jgi:hypothetical protein
MAPGSPRLGSTSKVAIASNLMASGFRIHGVGDDGSFTVLLSFPWFMAAAAATYVEGSRCSNYYPAT